MKLNLLVVIFIFLFAVLAGCDKKPEVAENSFAGNGFSLSEEELLAYLGLKNRANIVGERRSRLLNPLIERNAIAAIIAEENWPGITTAIIKIKEERNRILIDRYLEQFIAEKINDSSIEDFYRKNIEKYSDTKAHIAHILIRVPQSQNGTKLNERREFAESLIKAINEGEEFALVAKKHSFDKQTAAEGGEIGWVSRGMVENSILDTALSLETGQISVPIQTARGFHIIKLLEAPIQENIPFVEVRDKIEYDLKYELKIVELGRLRKSAEDRIRQDFELFDLYLNPRVHDGT